MNFLLYRVENNALPRDPEIPDGQYMVRAICQVRTVYGPGYMSIKPFYITHLLINAIFNFCQQYTHIRWMEY